MTDAYIPDGFDQAQVLPVKSETITGRTDLVDWADLAALSVRMLADVEESRVVSWDQWWELGPDRVDIQTAEAIRESWIDGFCVGLQLGYKEYERDRRRRRGIADWERKVRSGR